MNYFLGYLFENRHTLYHATLHGGLVGADAHTGPIGAIDVAGDRIPIL